MGTARRCGTAPSTVRSCDHRIRPRNVSVTIGEPPPVQRRQYRSGYVIDCGAAVLRVQARSIAIVLTLRGDVDAFNSDRVSVALRRFLTLGSPLIVDLDDLAFLGIAGFRALLAFDESCREQGVHCVMVVGTAAKPYLRVAPEATITVAASVHEALHQIADTIRSRRRILRVLTSSVIRLS